jgi:uncharacterized protein YuzE
VRVSYDPSADAGYISLRDIESGGSKHTVALEDLEADAGIEALGSIILDFDGEERLIGIEVLGASDVLPPELLRDAEPPRNG